jgi:hypothetical protein
MSLHRSQIEVSFEAQNIRYERSSRSRTLLAQIALGLSGTMLEMYCDIRKHRKAGLTRSAVADAAFIIQSQHNVSGEEIVECAYCEQP